MILVGSAAPDFTLSSQRGTSFHLADWRGRSNVLLLFLPAAFTPICTTELPALATYRDRFWTEAQTAVIAITTDNAPSNLAWARSCGGDAVTVLSDWNPHGAVASAYGVLAPDGVAERSTVIVDKNGIVRYSVLAGRYGKRSIPGLLTIASAVNGNNAVMPATQGLLPTLDLPVVYTASGCVHCANVKKFLADSGLSQRIVVRDVDQDPAGMQDMLDRTQQNEVPAMATSQGLLLGDAPIIGALAQAYGVPAPAAA